MRSIIALWLVTGCSLIIDPPIANHPDILINSITADSQANVAVAFTDERYLVVWQDASMTPPDSSSKAIRARFVSKTGVPQGIEFLVNDPSTSLNAQDHPQVAANGTSVLLVWGDASGLGGDGDRSIKGRIMSMTGDFLTPEILINTTLPGTQQDHQVIAAANNSFIVVWTDSSAQSPDVSGLSIRGRRFSATGVPLDTQDFVINSTTVGDQHAPSVARGLDGRLLVVWMDVAPGAEGEIRGRMLLPDGHPSGDDFLVNTTVSGNQEEPYVISTDDGYVVAWTDGSASAGDTDGRSVRARLFDANGVGHGDDFVLNARTQGDQRHPKLLQLADKSIFLAFEDGSMLPPDTDGIGVRARRLDPDGIPVGDDFQVNTYFVADQEDPALAGDADGNVIVLWEDGGASPPDGSSDSVRARIFPALP